MALRLALKHLLFSLLPTVVLLLAAEGAVRLFGLDRPSVFGGGLGSFGPGELDRVDTDLGWSPKPHFRNLAPGGPTVTLNSLGLRSPEVPREKGSEYRILSLGESSTFGIGVNDGQTYSARLEALLNGTRPRRPVRVINAGVSGYSSTQSLRYLTLRGLALKPDLIVFYHEMNDYLPATIRDIEVSGADLLRTDRQLLDSRLSRLSRTLLGRSALYRFISDRYAAFRLRRYTKTTAELPAAEVYPLGEIGFPRRTEFQRIGQPLERDARGEPRVLKDSYPGFIGRRVSEAERRENLEELLRVCAQNRARLVVVHPSYRPSTRHDCLLTAFCRERRVPMFEAYDSLHPGGDSSVTNPLFIDYMHPSAAGHERLARDLAAFILRTFGGI